MPFAAAGLLLDTDVASYLLKDHTLARHYRPLVAGHTLAISFMTFAELWEGALRSNWGTEKRRTLEASVDSYEIVPSSRAICLRWAEVRTVRRRQPISIADAWIAATALELNFPLVTNNSSDFRDIPGLHLITT